MKFLKTLITVCVMFIAVGMTAQSDDDQKIMMDAQDAKATLVAKDAEIEKFFKNSAGYVIFPNVGKGGFIIGAASGNGVVYENGTAVGMADLKKLNIGIQAGGQAIIEVIFFETEENLNHFKQGNFEFSAEASAVIADKGKSKDANYNDGVVVFALPKAGLMADASVGGQKFGFKPFAE